MEVSARAAIFRAANQKYHRSQTSLPMIKLSLKNIVSVSALLVAMMTAVPSAQAANVTLDAAGYYSLADGAFYYPIPGPAQSGRYRSLGDDYYRNAIIEVEYITNRSARRSGNLSFELHAMPFLGAKTGTVLMTTLVPFLPRNSFYSDVDRAGKALFTNERAFPELKIYERNSFGIWMFRDRLSFRTSTRL